MTSVSIRRQPGAISSRSETIAHRVPDYISIRMGLSRVASRDSSTTMLIHTCDSKQSQGYVQENCKAWVEVVFESMIDSRASRRFVVCSTQSRFFRPVAVKRIKTLSHVGSHTCRCSFLARHVETVIGCSRNLRARLSSRKRHTPGQFTFPSFFPSISTPYGDIRCKLLPLDYVSFREDFIDRFTIAINHARHTMASGGPLRFWPVRHSSIPANSGCPCYEQQ